ncbi:MAG TPA: gamma carbonic anhydrase family protein [Acetobacteraceae bacterium]|nr:gamma carbonic anhydrase family protein [Acetobacteraceae bacterium]
MPDLRMGRIEAVGGSGPLYALDGVAPRVHPSAFVAPTAAVIGNVEIGPESGVWFGTVIRADTNFIRIGARTNIQDGTIVHVDDSFPTLIGDDVTIGHAAIIHCCTLKDGAFVGMGSTVLDEAVIEEEGMLAAGGLLTPGKVIGRRELWTGSPAKLRRVMDEVERRGFDRNAEVYRRLAARYLTGLGPA